MKNKLMILFLLWQSGSFATVNIAEEKKTTQKTNTAKVRLRGIKPSEMGKKKKPFQVEGYVGSKYVRVVMDNSTDKLITGQMFIEDGAATYVYGEFVNDELHLYSPKGQHFTVIISK